jgi:hypothetical protein
MENKLESNPLTPEEISQGWHYCYTWKGDLIGPGNKKMDSCKCKVNKEIHRQIKKKYEIQ